MLILTRNTGQSIFVGSDIVITVVRIRDGSVRLGIDAPTHVTIERDDMRCESTIDRPE